MAEMKGGLREWLFGNEQHNREVFSHMFPGSQWDDYSHWVTPYTPIILYRDLLLEKDAGSMIGAARRGEGYVYRYDLNHPDRLYLSLVLAELQPVSTHLQGLTGWVRGLYDPKKGEELGGVAEEIVSFAKDKYAGLGEVIIPMMNPGMDTSQIFERRSTQVIGVLRDGKPRGLIHLLKGKKPEDGKPVINFNPKLLPEGV